MNLEKLSERELEAYLDYSIPDYASAKQINEGIPE